MSAPFTVRGPVYKTVDELRRGGQETAGPLRSALCTGGNENTVCGDAGAE